MKIVGLITEYNPFHNGHKYHIEKAKEVTGADTVIVVMSGNYVQRGTPAIMPKHLRTEVALEAGASLVIELPVCYATGSAEYFAMGAIALLHQLNCVDSICFGSECGEIDKLEQVAEIIAREPEEYRTYLQNYLKSGISFPQARQKALRDFLKEDTLHSVLEQPNNILGIEYIKAIRTLGSTIRPYTIKRMISGYHDTQLADTYSSATAIRKLLIFSGNALRLEEDTSTTAFGLSEILDELGSQIPSSCITMLEDTYRVRFPVHSNDYSLLLKFQLLNETKESLTQYFDVTEELANRIINQRNAFISFDQFCDLLKTRELTYSRISRVLLHILLNIKGDLVKNFICNGYHFYIRILGFRGDKTPLLSLLNDCSKLPLLSKLTDTTALSEEGLSMLRTDIYAADLYESIITDKFKYPFVSEYEHALVKL